MIQLKWIPWEYLGSFLELFCSFMTFLIKNLDNTLDLRKVVWIYTPKRQQNKCQVLEGIAVSINQDYNLTLRNNSQPHYSQINSWPIAHFWNPFCTAYLGTYVLFPHLLSISTLPPMSVCLTVWLDFLCVAAFKYLKPPTQIIFFFKYSYLFVKPQGLKVCLLCFNESLDAWAYQRWEPSKILVFWTTAIHPNSSPKHN